MNKLWLLLGLLAGSCQPAFADNLMVPCVTQTNSAGFSSCAPVTASNPLPVTVSGGSISTTGSITAGTGFFCTDGTGNCIYQASGAKTSGNGAGVQLRNGTDGNVAYLAVDSWVNGGTNYHQLDVQAAQSDGIVCISGGGLGCGLTLGTTNSVIIANASTHAGQAACYTTSGQMGFCTTIVGASGGCTCTGF